MIRYIIIPMKNLTGSLMLLWVVCCGIGSLPFDAMGHDLPAKIQGAFWGISPIDQAEQQLRLLKQSALNTALVNDSGHEVKVNLWPEWAKIAATYELCLFPIHSFAGTAETAFFREKFIPYIDHRGNEFSSTPCPLDTTYWDISIAKRFAQLATLSIGTPFAGVLFDTEMYGGDFPLYERVCFCDECWKKFVQTERFFLSVKEQNPEKLERTQRFKYLLKHDLLEEYAAYQENVLETILMRIERQIHAINPDLWLGFLGYRNNWFYRGLIRGLGTSTRPVLVFSESSYIRGYTPYVTREKSGIMRLQRSGRSSDSKADTLPIARYIPGLWQSRFWPDEMVSQLYQLATHADGYWIFSADSLWDATRKTGHYTLHGSPDDYWTAFKKTHEALGQFPEASDTNASTVAPVYLSSFYDSTQNRLLTQPSLREFWSQVWPQFKASVMADEPERQQVSAIVYRGRALFHGLKQQHTGSIELTHISLSAPTSTTYKLFDTQGTMVQQGTLNRNAPSTTLLLPSEMSGIFSLLTDSGSNLAQVTFSEIPFVVEASNTFPLKTFNTAHTYAAYVRPEDTRLTLRAYCSSAEESASIAIHSAEGKRYDETDVVEYTEMNIRTHLPPGMEDSNGIHSSPQLSLQLGVGQVIPLLPPKQGGHIVWSHPNFWGITVAPVPLRLFEDIHFYLYNEEFPYLIMSME